MDTSSSKAKVGLISERFYCMSQLPIEPPEMPELWVDVEMIPLMVSSHLSKWDKVHNTGYPHTHHRERA